ncbi:LysE/ArgO family amino acid transporter [Ferdinandcohnia sp. Marseille-Q9671]
MVALFHGILLAFGLILPLGVQNVFIFNQGATQKRFTYVLPAIITASICDTILISLAVTGVSVIVFGYEWVSILLFSVGFLFLIYMGLVIWRSTGDIENQNEIPFTARRQITFALSVSLLNPHAIMDTIGVIGTSSLVYKGYEKWMFTIACITVSWLWFFALAFVGRKVGQLSGNALLFRRINQVSAIIVWVMAIYLGYQLLILV